MPLAFCILAHKNPAQVARLVRAIWRPENTYVLHYDRRAPRIEHQQLMELTREFPGVQVLPPRRVNWGRFSQMQAQLDMMARAVAVGPAWTHLFTLSGQDFPLRKVSEMDAELAVQPGLSWLSWFDPIQDKVWPNAEQRLTRWFFDSFWLEWLLALPGVGRWVRSLCGWQNTFPTMPWIRRTPPPFLRWFGGANHHVLSRGAVRILLEDSRSCQIARWLEHSGHPDETFVQTALLNSSLSDTIVNDDRRAIFWDEGAASPRTLTVRDLPRLRQASDAGKLFARKFDPAVDACVIAALEGMLHTQPALTSCANGSV